MKTKNILFAAATLLLSLLFLQMRNKDMMLMLHGLIFILYSLIANRSTPRFATVLTILPVAILSYVVLFLKYHPEGHLLLFCLILAGAMLLGFLAGWFLLRWRWMKKHVNLLLLCIATFGLSALCNTLGPAASFFATGVLYLAAVLIAHRYLHYSKHIGWIIYAPLLLINLADMSHLSVSYYLVGLVPVLSLLVYYVVASRVTVWRAAVLGLYGLFLVGGWVVGVPNYCQWAYERKIAQDAPIALYFHDLSGRAITSDSLRGKVVVLDFWNIFCGSCFRAFPHLEQVYIFLIMLFGQSK